jgi:hypothetical protein
MGFSDFRPISLLLKVCEVLMAGQMIKHIHNFGILCPLQLGFRRHHSTATAVIKVTEDQGEFGASDCFGYAGFYSDF